MTAILKILFFAAVLSALTSHIMWLTDWPRWEHVSDQSILFACTWCIVKAIVWAKHDTRVSVEDLRKILDKERKSTNG